MQLRAIALLGTILLSVLVGICNFVSQIAYNTFFVETAAGSETVWGKGRTANKKTLIGGSVDGDNEPQSSPALATPFRSLAI